MKPSKRQGRNLGGCDLKKSCNDCSRMSQLPRRREFLLVHSFSLHHFSQPGVSILGCLSIWSHPIYFSTLRQITLRRAGYAKEKAHSANCKNGPFSLASLVAAKIRRPLLPPSVPFFPVRSLLRNNLLPRDPVVYISEGRFRPGSDAP